MNRLIKIGSFAYITVFLFPLLAGDDYILKNYPLPIKFPPLLFLLAIFLPFLIKSLIVKGGWEMFRIYRYTGWVFVPFGMLALVSFAWGLHPGANWNDGFKPILMDSYHWILLMLSVMIAQSWTIKKYHQQIFMIIFSAACIAIVADMFFPGLFSVLTHRAGGFYGDANQGAMSVLFLAIASINWKKNVFLNLVILIVSGFAIFFTLSVANLILYFAVIFLYLLVNLKGKGHSLRKFALVVGVPILIFYAITPLVLGIISNSEMFNNPTSRERMDQIVALSEGNFDFASDHERKNLVLEFWAFVQKDPVLGQGTGFSTKEKGTFGPHNMYLRYWVDNGLLGLLAYLLLLGGAFRYFMILKDVRGMIFIFAFIFEGFFDHNLLSNRTIIVLLGLFGTLAYLQKSKPPTIDNPGGKLA